MNTKNQLNYGNMAVEVVLKKEMTYQQSLEVLKKIKDNGWKASVFEKGFHNHGLKRAIHLSVCKECLKTLEATASTSRAEICKECEEEIGDL